MVNHANSTRIALPTLRCSFVMQGYVKFDLSLVVSITVICYSWAPFTGVYFIHMWHHLWVVKRLLANTMII